MGRRYAFELVYRTDALAVAVEALGAFLPTDRRPRVRPPVADLSGLTPDSPVFAELSLLFPADAIVRGYYPQDDVPSEWTDEGVECLPIGAIDLAVRVGQRHGLLTFGARTSGMSDVFEQSPGVWGQFAAILQATGGLAGVFHGAVSRGLARYPLLPDGREAVELDFFDFVQEERELFWQLDADRYADAILGGLRR